MSSSSSLPLVPASLPRPQRLILFHASFSSPIKDQQTPRLRTKLPMLAKLNLDGTTTQIVSKRPTGRKLMRYMSKLEVDSSCKKLPAQIRSSVSNCKHYLLQSNHNLSRRGIIPFAKAIQRSSPKHLQSLQISTINPCTYRVNVKSLLNLIASKRDLKTLKLTINPYLNATSLLKLQRTFSTLKKLETLSITTSNLAKDITSQETPNPLGTIISNVRRLKHFYLKCYVTRTTCEELNRIIEKLTENNCLEKIELFLDTPDRLPTPFYSLLSEKLSAINGLSSLGITIDSFMTQRFSNSFFLPLSRIQTLKKFMISTHQLSISDSEMQALFSTLVSLSNLKEFGFRSGGRAINFSNRYYVSLHEALRQLTQLEELTYDIKNLGSNHFPDLFDKLPLFPRLRSLSLNVTISQEELGNVRFLSEFLKRTQHLKHLSLKINNGNSDTYTYHVPSEVFGILEEGLKAIPSLERFELSLGSIEDTGLNKILLTLDELTKLSYLKLDAFFYDITSQAFGNLCANLRRQKRKLRRVQIIPKCYPHSNYDLLSTVINEIHTEQC